MPSSGTTAAVASTARPQRGGFPQHARPRYGIPQPRDAALPPLWKSTAAMEKRSSYGKMQQLRFDFAPKTETCAGLACLVAPQVEIRSYGISQPA